MLSRLCSRAWVLATISVCLPKTSASLTQAFHNDNDHLTGFVSTKETVYHYLGPHASSPSSSSEEQHVMLAMPEESVRQLERKASAWTEGLIKTCPEGTEQACLRGFPTKIIQVKKSGDETPSATITVGHVDDHEMEPPLTKVFVPIPPLEIPTPVSPQSRRSSPVPSPKPTHQISHHPTPDEPTKTSYKADDFNRVSVEGFGNAQFAVIAHQLNHKNVPILTSNTATQHTELSVRTDIVQWLRKHGPHFIHKPLDLDLHFPDFVGPWEEYLRGLERVSAWGDNLTVIVACQLYQVHIVVMQENTDFTPTFEPWIPSEEYSNAKKEGQLGDVTLMVYFRRAGRYFSMVRKD